MEIRVDLVPSTGASERARRTGFRAARSGSGHATVVVDVLRTRDGRAALLFERGASCRSR
jgi:hypothetical protein